jgi:ribonuclease BN (tRNA processing enzyme)
MWFTVGRTNFVVDPGPGALVRATAKRKPKLDPTRLDGIILSHGHLDHYPSPDLLGSLIWRFALNSKYQYNVIRGVAPHLAVVAPFGWL